MNTQHDIIGYRLDNESLRIFVRLHVFYIHFIGLTTKECELVGINKIRISLARQARTDLFVSPKISYFHELCHMDDKFVARQIFLSSSKCSTSILDALRIFTHLRTSLCMLHTFYWFGK